MATRPNFRGMQIQVIGCNHQDGRHLKSQFANLGIDGFFATQVATDAEAFVGIDLIIFDGDSPDLFHPTRKLPWPDRPRIALTGVETPSRLKWIAEQQVVGYLRKPIRHDGLLTVLTLAHHFRQQQQQMQQQLEQQQQRLQARRFVFAAQLRLMRHWQLDEDEAYRRLRSEAMRQQKTVEQLAIELEAQPDRWLKFFSEP